MLLALCCAACLFFHLRVVLTLCFFFFSSGSGSKLGTLVLCDFGLTRRLSKTTTTATADSEQQLTPLVVTLYYRAIEILLGNGCYNESIDVWSIGCVFAELLLNRVLLPGKGEINQLSLIFNTLGGPSTQEQSRLSQYTNSSSMNWVEISKHTNQLSTLMREVLKDESMVEGVVNLLKGMLCYDPSLRLTAKQARQHVFFNSEPKATALHQMPRIEM